MTQGGDLAQEERGEEEERERVAAVEVDHVERGSPLPRRLSRYLLRVPLDEREVSGLRQHR